ncbi:hypothetical protein [Croceicoccus naphthovorans]|uniref:Uncharacterized protein n=1 Tax=Croceicoccus naphthovorans TaxID=1348774 RepID=A0A0G3XD51_9SPHN|nr:hypothetical protein [Croceicoccus naphthovorans]AKM09087.1 hypothetical protein AB433_02495 [Croceicoccus naphthovorans]
MAVDGNCELSFTRSLQVLPLQGLQPESRLLQVLSHQSLRRPELPPPVQQVLQRQVLLRSVPKRVLRLLAGNR